jgi:hypothetical protein
VHVEQDHIGQPLVDELDGGGGLVGLAHHVDRVAQLGLDPGPEDGVVLDQEDAGPGGRTVGGRHLGASRTIRAAWTELDLGPLPGAERMTAEPPWRHAGPDGLGDALAVPGHRVGVEARPRSRTKSMTVSASTSA